MVLKMLISRWRGVSYDALGLDTIVYFPNIGGDCV